MLSAHGSEGAMSPAPAREEAHSEALVSAGTRSSPFRSSIVFASLAGLSSRQRAMRGKRTATPDL